MLVSNSLKSMDALQRTVLVEVKLIQVVRFLSLPQNLLVMFDYLLLLQSIDLVVFAVRTFAKRRAADAGGITLAVVLLAACFLTVAAASMQLLGNGLCFHLFVL